jgi:hypothetical protein
MKRTIIIITLMAWASLAMGAPNQRLFDTLVSIASSLGEIEDDLAIPKKVTDLPIEMQSLFELTDDEEKQLESGQHIYTKKEFKLLLQKASESGVAMPVLTRELINRSEKTGLNPYQRTLAYRMVQAEIKRQAGN